MLCAILCASKVPVEIHKRNRAISDFRSEGCRPLESPSDVLGYTSRQCRRRATRKWHRNRLGLISRNLLDDGTLFRASALDVYRVFRGNPKKLQKLKNRKILKKSLCQNKKKADKHISLIKTKRK